VSIRVHSWFKSHPLRLSVKIRANPWRKKRPWHCTCLRGFTCDNQSAMSLRPHSRSKTDLGLESPSYRNTHGRAGYGSARVPRQGCRRQPKRYNTHTHTPADSRPRLACTQGYQSQTKAARAGKAQLQKRTQASRVRKCPGAAAGMPPPTEALQHTRTRGLPSAARLRHRSYSCPFVSIRGSKHSASGNHCRTSPGISPNSRRSREISPCPDLFAFMISRR
jgi:hypothetical protein